MNMNTPHARGPIQNYQVCGIIWYLKQYLETMYPSMNCSHPIFKHSDYFLSDGTIASLIFEPYIFK